MLYNLKRLLNNTVTVMEIGYKIARGIDYKTLSQHILNINQFRDIDGILYEVSRCLRDILDHELFGFAVKDGDSLDVWIDPRYYSNMSLIGIIQKDFGNQENDYKIHYFNHEDTEKSDKVVDLKFNLCINDMLSYAVMENRYIARLYILPKRKMLYYHREIISIIVRMIGIALENSMNIKRLENAAAIDPLTNCYNRQAFNSYIEHDIANGQRYGSDLSIIMFDIDHFKKINDSYGHQAGDTVLKEVCRSVTSTIRKSDYLARYGGEEFILVLPDTKFSNAVELAEKLRRKVENYKINLGDKTINITASFGVAGLRNGSDSCRLLQEADEMLYKAKANGRNNVMPNLRLCTTNVAALQGALCYYHTR